MFFYQNMNKNVPNKMSCSWNIIKGLRGKDRTCTAHMSCHIPILALLPCFHPICITPKRIISLVSLFVGFSNDNMQCIYLEPRIKQNYTEKREWLPAMMKVGIQCKADKAKPWYAMSICIQQMDGRSKSRFPTLVWINWRVIWGSTW